MKKIMMTLLLLATVCVNVNAYFDGNHYSGLNIKYAGTEGTEMVCCYAYLYYHIHNITDEPIDIIEQYEGLGAYAIIEREGEPDIYYKIGQFFDLDVIQPNEKKDIRILVNFLELMDPYDIICIGSNTTEGGVPSVKFCTEFIGISPYVDFDLTKQFNISGIEKIGNQNVLPSVNTSVDISITNNEDVVLSMVGLWVDLYEMDDIDDYEHASLFKSLGSYNIWADPHATIDLVKDIKIQGLNNGKFYFLKIRTNNWKHEIACSEPFTVNTSTGINGISANEADMIIYDIQGRRLESVPETGIYLIKTDKGTRKVVR